MNPETGFLSVAIFCSIVLVLYLSYWFFQWKEQKKKKEEKSFDWNEELQKALMEEPHARKYIQYLMMEKMVNDIERQVAEKDHIKKMISDCDDFVVFNRTKGKVVPWKEFFDEIIEVKDGEVASHVILNTEEEIEDRRKRK